MSLKRRSDRRRHQSPRKLRRKVLPAQVAARLRARHRYTLNLRFYAEQISTKRLNALLAEDGGLQPNADMVERLHILAVFGETLGQNWVNHARQPLPRRRPEDCPKDRPCQRVCCEWHLAVERTRLGSLRLVHPGVPLEQQQAQYGTCAWDVIRNNPDGLSLEAIGHLFAMGRPRVHGLWREIQSKLQFMRPDLAGKLKEEIVRQQIARTDPAETKVPPPAPSTPLKGHPIAAIFPQLGDGELHELADDIREHGLHERITLYQGMILDGRNRYAACLLAEVEPLFTEWMPSRPGETPLEFVLSMNLHRRHLDESQRAMVAAKVRELLKPAASERQEASRSKPGEKVGSTSDGKAGPKSTPPSRTAVQAAVALKVSPTSVKAASKVLSDGAPEVIQKVVDGDLAVSVAADLAKLPPEKQVEVVRQNKAAIKRAVQQVRREESHKRRVKRAVELANESAAAQRVKPEAIGRYPVILVDNPWEYDHPVSDSREVPYPTMPLADIKALPVASVATKDAMLFCWVPPAKVADAVHVIEAWGFTVCSSEVWEKPSVGPGYYYRLRHELVLLASRGKPITPAERDRPDSIFRAPRGRHSEKPEEHYRRIERMYRGLPRIELFARKRREGWVSVGCAIDGRDIRDVLKGASASASARA